MNHIVKLAQAGNANSTSDYSFISMARELVPIEDQKNVDKLAEKAGELFREACSLGLVNEYAMTKGLMTWPAK